MWLGSVKLESIFSMISKGSILRVTSLLYSPMRNLSLLKMTHTKSPSSNSTGHLSTALNAFHCEGSSYHIEIVQLITRLNVNNYNNQGETK
jgi:hypothetical protein